VGDAEWFERDQSLSNPVNRKALKVIVSAVRKASGPKPADDSLLWKDLQAPIQRYHVQKILWRLNSSGFRKQIKDSKDAVSRTLELLELLNQIPKNTALIPISDRFESSQTPRRAI
jgi:hypothetical protein